MKGDNVGLEDACQAFFEAGQAKDWPAAAMAMSDCYRLADYEEPEEPEEGPPEGKGGKGGPAIALIFGEKGKKK
jgi:hypothetical protein